MNVTIYERQENPNCRIIYSLSDFFNSKVYVENHNTHAIFKKPDIDFNGKSYKPTKRKSGFMLTVSNNNLPSGQYSIDPEESNEDQIVIYFE